MRTKPHAHLPLALVGVVLMSLVAIFVDTVPASAQGITAVANTAALYSIACPGSTTCLAVGYAGSINPDPYNARAVVVPITSGVPGTPVDVAGTSLGSVACPSQTQCFAGGGFYQGPESGGMLVSITNSVPQSPTYVAFTPISGIACPSPIACVAVGQDFSNAVGAVVPVANGVPGSPVSVANTQYLSAVACSSASSCLAVGSNGTEGVVVPVTSGVPGSPVVVTGTTSLNGVVCKELTSCTVVGQAGSKGAIVGVNNGVPGTVQTIRKTTSLNTIACAQTCTEVGRHRKKGVSVSTTFAVKQYRGPLFSMQWRVRVHALWWEQRPFTFITTRRWRVS